ncbi:double-strand break repair helicase AddA [Altererythrobacter soli]|uniref:DNA 3'-5' helicase n=1 Tax=Croceibacterium soli TaxID=1739690 RepID=A0A6I4UYW9_9SPHN|nr:double-strand break repair helicase AddA [Croceibacterium soli]MXP42447.1 double-strand break repair helicase AddA [Croceibacterium soli]
MSGTVHPLKGDQAQAVDPQDSVWLSASAGTGKTQVLSARVLRLLLRDGVEPGQILCLTFTKAGAAEMATRVNEVLANWVRLPDTELAGDLIAIGAPHGPEDIARARSLFAQVLDCPGGGLRIDTIHAFSQWLLAAFPQEAGLIPGTKPMEDRDRDLLAHRLLADLLVEWEERGDPAMLAALEDLSIRMGADGARKWLMRCAEAREAWFGPGAWQEPMGDRVRQLIGLDLDAGPESLTALCSDDVFDCGALRRCLQANGAWGTATARKCIEAVEEWLAGDPAARAEGCGALAKALFTNDGNVRSLRYLEKHDPEYAATAEQVRQCVEAVREHAALIALADLLVPALTIGRRFALAWDEAKTREGLIDFDDQIRQAAALLSRSEISDWIRYKLDRQFDHILIDEAQDTNAAQWDIIRALTEEFYAGEGQRDGKLRTIFVVGDYKQAIFRFQGTSPENFEIARKHFASVMAAAAAGTTLQRTEARELQRLGLGRSYRTAQPVLDFVDAAIEAIGPTSFGLADHPGYHVGDDRPGVVGLWAPVGAQPEDEDEAEGEPTDNWLPGPERRMADKIAAQVRQWLDEGYPLVKGGARNAGPGDIMVLVRKRRELAGLIVARLHAAGVPVAGVDRLRLGAPLAVKDLMAALRFAAQPLDDLSLACLLVSPLIGWSQEQLLEHGYREKGAALWHHLRRSTAPEAVLAAGELRQLLARADFEPPQALLHWLLLGPWQGRRKLVSRLGREANDPIDELLNAAHSYAAGNVPSLQGFIQWFDAGEGELKREPGASGGLVRVMTVHGSKGLQAPIVILADATGDPDRSPTRGLALKEEVPGGEGRSIPLPPLAKEEKVGRVAAAEAEAARAEREEHWRLLYVAMTRAEEALFVGGALLATEDEPAEDSWYARLAPLVDATPVEDGIWGWRLEHGARPAAIPREDAVQEPARLPLPAWATTPIGPEPRPPRPLAPSAVGHDQGADPPFPPGADALAARRGVLIHKLLERLPELPPEEREGRAREWLSRQAADVPDPDREAMLSSALAVLSEPGWAEIFSPHALAEVPLAATVGGQVIAGTADRLLVEPDRVLVVDFKTARRPPTGLADMPNSTLRQMAAYAAALGVIYPGRRIEAAVLYTQTPLLVPIPAETLAEHKAGLAAGEESFAG